ncbi:MAG: hypothetical protein WCI96_00925 [Planctomycetota bacterium]|jgi:hypothetical protein
MQNNNEHGLGMPADDEPRSMPLSFEDGKEAISVAAGNSRKRFGFGAMLFTGVAAIAVISLFSMRAIGRAGASEVMNTEAESLVDTFLKDQAEKTGGPSPLESLDAEAYAKMQILREELRKNPFIIAGEEMVLQIKSSNATKVASPVMMPEDSHPSRGMGWDSACAAAASAVVVQSSMVSSNPANSMAHVNGQVLRVGETLSINGSTVVFTISEITKDGIVLRAWNEDLQREAIFRVIVGGISNGTN